MGVRLPQFVLLLFLVFAVSCSSAQKPMTNTPASSTKQPVSLVGTEWLLDDVAGTPVVANSKASLAFLDGERASGNGSCNRFTGAFTISGDSLKFGPLASTRMACIDGGVSAQEEQYLKLLAAAKRYVVKDGALLLYVEGDDKPLRFSRQSAPNP